MKVILLRELILFSISFIVMFLIYEILIFRLSKKLLGKETELIEASYLEKKYKLDMKKVNYKKLRNVIAFVSSFDIALIVSIIANLNNFILEIIIGFISMVLIILISYHMVYLVYKKKGMIKNESKRNRG